TVIGAPQWLSRRSAVYLNCRQLSPLLALSGHPVLRRICPLMTQSGHSACTKKTRLAGSRVKVVWEEALSEPWLGLSRYNIPIYFTTRYSRRSWQAGCLESNRVVYQEPQRPPLRLF